MIVKLATPDMNGYMKKDVRYVQQENMNPVIRALIVLQIHGLKLEEWYRRPLVIQLLIILVNVYQGIITLIAVKNAQQVLTKQIMQVQTVHLAWTAQPEHTPLKLQVHVRHVHQDFTVHLNQVRVCSVVRTVFRKRDQQNVGVMLDTLENPAAVLNVSLVITNLILALLQPPVCRAMIVQ